MASRNSLAGPPVRQKRDSGVHQGNLKSAIIVASRAGAWVATGWRLDAAHCADIAARDAQLAAANDLARLREQDWTAQRNQALENANSRDQTILALAADSAGASLGLRDTLAATSRGVPDASVEALRHSPTTWQPYSKTARTNIESWQKRLTDTPATR